MPGEGAVPGQGAALLARSGIIRHASSIDRGNRLPPPPPSAGRPPPASAAAARRCRRRPAREGRSARRYTRRISLQSPRSSRTTRVTPCRSPETPVWLGDCLRLADSVTRLADSISGAGDSGRPRVDPCSGHFPARRSVAGGHRPPPPPPPDRSPAAAARLDEGVRPARAARRRDVPACFAAVAACSGFEEAVLLPYR